MRHRPTPLPGIIVGLLAAASVLILAPQPVWALSEIQRQDLPPASPGGGGDGTIAPDPAEPGGTMPGTTLPAEPGAEAPGGETSPPDAGAGEEEDVELPPGGGLQRPDIEPGEPLPEIIYDATRLPEPVARMRGLLLEAAKSGDIEALRPLIGSGEEQTQLSLGGLDGDPIDFLKEVSGDGEGQEILAIMQEVLEAGYVHLDAGTPEELYVWPYFFAIPLDRLDARQRVELFTIVTAGDYEDMKTYGAYIFYRVGITPEGRWAFFVAGD